MLLVSNQLGNFFVKFNGKGPFTGHNKGLVNPKTAVGEGGGEGRVTFQHSFDRL